MKSFLSHACLDTLYPERKGSATEITLPTGWHL